MVDVTNTQRISGWCHSRIFKTSPVTLRVYCDGIVIGSTTANLPRQDMLVNGFHPTGLCGFEFKFPTSLDWKNIRHVSIKPPFPPLDLFRIRTSDMPRVVTECFPPVFFMHIPKTAGTSFNTFVSSYLPEDEAAIHIEARNAEEYPAIFRNHAYVSGHLMMHAYKNIPLNAERRLYSIVRSPFHQVHSQLNWMRWIAVDQSRGLFTQQEKAFSDLALQIHSTPLNDASALRDFIAGMDEFALQLFDNIQTRFFLDDMPEKVSMADLQEAKKNLSLFEDVGLTENYAAFQERFCRACGLSIVPQPARYNYSTMPPIFDVTDKGIQEALAPMVEVDLELYRHIQATFG